jgi:hypothetical protein
MPEPPAPPAATSAEPARPQPGSFTDRVKQAYRTADGGTAESALTPEQAAVENNEAKAAIRSSAAFTDPHHPGHAAAMQELEDLYRAEHGELLAPRAPADPAESSADALNRVAAEASALDLSKHAGKDVAQDAQDALRVLTVSHDIPPTELPAFLAEAAQAQGRAGMDQATREAAREAVLRKEWGDHYDVWAQRAWSVVAELPPRLQAYAEEYRMGEDPWMWLRAVELWKRKHR